MKALELTRKANYLALTFTNSRSDLERGSEEHREQKQRYYDTILRTFEDTIVEDHDETLDERGQPDGAETETSEEERPATQEHQDESQNSSQSS